jgi:hypothetical protein
MQFLLFSKVTRGAFVFLTVHCHLILRKMRSVFALAAAAVTLVHAGSLTAQEKLYNVLQQPGRARHAVGGSVMLGIAQQMRISDAATAAVQTGYFSQQLNHFNPLSNTTYQQRYYTNNQFWNGSVHAPVFLYVGGEGSLSIFSACCSASALQFSSCSFCSVYRRWCNL